MRKCEFFILFISLAVIFTIGWRWTNVGHTWNLRPLTVTSEAQFWVVSDSDTVWTEHVADRLIDSLFVIGGVERGVTLEFFFCPYGDSGKVTLLWFYGNDRYTLLVDTIVDTTLASLDTLHETYAMTHFQDKWASVMFGDSIDPTAGDSVRYWLVEYDQ